MMTAILNFVFDWLKCDYVISIWPIMIKFGMYMHLYGIYIVSKFEFDIFIILVSISIYAK